MQTISYDNTNAFLGQSSTIVYILGYFANVFAVFALKIYILNNFADFLLKNACVKFLKSLNFNIPIFYIKIL